MADTKSRVNKHKSKYIKEIDRNLLQKILIVCTTLSIVQLFLGFHNLKWPDSGVWYAVRGIFICSGLLGFPLFCGLAIRNAKGRLFPRRYFATEPPTQIPYSIKNYEYFEGKVRTNVKKLGYMHERVLDFKNGDKLTVFTKFDTKVSFEIAYEKVAIYKCKYFTYCNTCTIDQNLNMLKPIGNYGVFQQMFYHDMNVELEFRIPNSKIESIIFIVVEEDNFYSSCAIEGYHEEDNLVALIDLSYPNVIKIGKDIRKNKTSDYNDKYVELLRIIS